MGISILLTLTCRLRGPLILYKRGGQSDGEVIVQLTDWYHEGHQALIHQLHENMRHPFGTDPLFKSGLINGIGQFDCSRTAKECEQNPRYPPLFLMKPELHRVRIMNVAAMADFEFSIDGYLLTVIEVDGIDVMPYAKSDYQHCAAL